MSQIEELQRRITMALDRIGQGLESAAASGGEDVDALRRDLEEEKLANAQLKERISKLKASHAKELEEAKAASGKQGAELTKLDAELQALRKANQQLRDNNQALREANAAGVAEPHLINKAMLAELEGLRASRAADSAEVGAILSKIDDVLAGADDDSKEPEDA